METNSQMFAQTCAELTALHERKNHDYGDTFGELFTELSKYSKRDAMTYLIGHLQEKLNRIKTLTYEGNLVKGESVTDSMQDLACYDIMGLTILKTLNK